MTNATQTKQETQYSIKGLKTGPSREWGPNGSFTCNLYCGKKKIASVFEAGDGGDMDVDYVSSEDEKAFKKSFEGKKLDNEYGMDLDYNDGLAISDLIEEFEQNKYWKRKCKKLTIFKLEGQKEGEWNSLSHPFDARMKLHLDKKYGDKLIEIMNKRFI